MTMTAERTAEERKAYFAKLRAENRAASIYDWEVSRSGQSMTVTGKDADGQPMKLTGVTSLMPGDADGGYIFAISPKGSWFLRLGRTEA